MENQLVQITDKEIQALVHGGVIPKETPIANIKVFAKVCNALQLDPFTKEIYIVGYQDKKGNWNDSIITSINGFRKIASRTGQYAGSDDAKFDLQSNGRFKTASELLAEGKKPTTCTVTVYRVVGGVRCPFTHTAVFKEFEGSSYSQWPKMPFQMIAKVAESFALRKAFGGEFQGVHTEEEVAVIKQETKQATTALPEPTPEELQQMCNRALKIGAEAVVAKAEKYFSLTEEQKEEIHGTVATANAGLV
jgi:phage recombination protein Bet